MSARQEKVREALEYWPQMPPAVANAALAEVEEWERWLDLADADRERLSAMVGNAERAYEREKARAETAEAERDRLTNKLNEDSQNFQIECQKSENALLRAERDRLKDALDETLTMTGALLDPLEILVNIAKIARAALGES
jgi:hypothetical protein